MLTYEEGMEIYQLKCGVDGLYLTLETLEGIVTISLLKFLATLVEAFDAVGA